MEKLEFGETAVLDGGKEYICFGTAEVDNNSYVYLVSNSKPIDVKFAKQILANGELNLELVSSSEEKERLLQVFKDKMSKEA